MVDAKMDDSTAARPHKWPLAAIFGKNYAFCKSCKRKKNYENGERAHRAIDSLILR